MWGFVPFSDFSAVGTKYADGCKCFSRNDLTEIALFGMMNLEERSEVVERIPPRWIGTFHFSLASNIPKP